MSTVENKSPVSWMAQRPAPAKSSSRSSSSSDAFSDYLSQKRETEKNNSSVPQSFKDIKSDRAQERPRQIPKAQPQAADETADRGKKLPKSNSTTGSQANSRWATTSTRDERAPQGADDNRADDVNDTSFDRRPVPPGSDRDFSAKVPERIDNRGDNVAQRADKLTTQMGQDVQARRDKKDLEESVDSLERRQALQHLLKRMKDELDVDAEDIVAAFATLSPQELRQPPEMTLDKIIQALPLDPGQQAVARGIFQDMLKQTAANDMADYLKGSQRQLSLEVVSQREAQRRQIGESLARMQDQFFAPQGKPTHAVKPDLNQAMQRYQAQKSDEGDPGGEFKATLAEGSLSTSGGFDGAKSAAGIDLSKLGMTPVTTGSEMSAGISLDDLNLTGEAGKVAKSGTEVSSVLPAKAQLAGEADQTSAAAGSGGADVVKMMYERQFGLHQMPAQPAVSGATAASTGAAPMTAIPQPSAMATLPTMNLAIASARGGEGSDAGGGDEDASAGQGEWSQSLSQAVGRAPGETVAPKGESFTINTQPTQAQDAKNIREVISQAQFLAQKGGGEMKVTLSPEGLGQVAMKVAVKGGQVNVEMVADSNEAKKVLERGLGELKSTLLAHDLKVDQIKVDVPSDISKQLSQQHDQAQRQFAQQFLEQFRQDNNEWRRGFYDIAGAKSYGSQRDEASGNVASGPTSERRRDSSRRLDLVA